MLAMFRTVDLLMERLQVNLNGFLIITPLGWGIVLPSSTGHGDKAESIIHVENPTAVPNADKIITLLRKRSLHVSMTGT